MSVGVVGRKCGMSRVFGEDGQSIPVTVIEIEPNRVTQVKTLEQDGYSAVQVAVGSRRASRITKAQAGHYAKAGSEAGGCVRELRASAAELEPLLEAGAGLTVEQFEAGQAVDVSGVSKCLMLSKFKFSN